MILVLLLLSPWATFGPLSLWCVCVCGTNSPRRAICRSFLMGFALLLSWAAVNFNVAFRSKIRILKYLEIRTLFTLPHRNAAAYTGYVEHVGEIGTKCQNWLTCTQAESRLMDFLNETISILSLPLTLHLLLMLTSWLPWQSSGGTVVELSSPSYYFRSSEFLVGILPVFSAADVVHYCDCWLTKHFP